MHERGPAVAGRFYPEDPQALREEIRSYLKPSPPGNHGKIIGIIVPHAIRLVTSVSYRVIVPLSVLLGGAFLALADIVARTVLSPAEIPIGVVPALTAPPFFPIVLRTSKGVVSCGRSPSIPALSSAV